MKPWIVLILAAWPVGWIAACEGEPPVMAPENSLQGAPPPAASAAAAPVVPAATAASAPSAGVAANAANPQGPVPAASTSAGPVASGAQASAPAPAADAVFDITGAVATKPASARSSAVVYLEDGPKRDDEARHPVSIVNQQMRFAPFVAVTEVGSKVAFVNGDPFPHNIFSPDNEKFNLGMIPQKSTRTREFATAGAYSLLCNLHPNMLGYLLVVPNGGWYAKADAAGQYAIKRVPKGTYKVTAWAPRQVAVTQTVTVGDGDAKVDFDLHR
jgi:plastocyanin